MSARWRRVTNSSSRMQTLSQCVRVILLKGTLAGRRVRPWRLNLLAAALSSRYVANCFDSKKKKEENIESCEGNNKAAFHPGHLQGR